MKTIADMILALGLLLLCILIAAIGPAGAIFAIALLAYLHLRNQENDNGSSS